MNEPLVSNVSDTARWVATYRAWESARADALFRDPLAEQLAGERGKAMTQIMPRPARSGWPLIVRTKLIDDLIMQCVQQGCDCVVNLAAGLDTRPYRMSLPASLQWIEVDLPQMIDEKERLLLQHTPICQLSRRPVDLADRLARRQLLDEIGARSNAVLVIAEGLLVYLNESVVTDIARDLLAQSAVRWWVYDLAGPGLLTMMQQSAGSQLERAPMQFAPANGVAFLEALGWVSQDIRPILQEAGRLRRLPLPFRPFAWLPAANPRRPGRSRWSAVIRMGRAAV